MSDELKAVRLYSSLITHHSSLPSLITRHDRDGLGLAASEGEVVVADADFEGVAERRGAHRSAGRAGDDAHLHHPTRDRTLALHGEHARLPARAQAVERRDRRFKGLFAFDDCVRQTEGCVGGAHESLTDDFRIKLAVGGTLRRPTDSI